jgi:FkbM family methyltransferase
MRKLLFRLSRSAFARDAARFLRLTKIANAWLRRFPFVRRLPGSGVVYRAARLESIPLAVEMFERNLYDASLLPANFSTFADLGCNVGYFTCWLAHLAKQRSIKGLMIDANPDAVKEAEWHVRANRWTGVYTLNGIVGEHSPSGFVDFYLYESNICSNSSLEQMQQLGLKGQWTKIQVPCLTLSTEWKKRFGSDRCNLLKIDVEGSEMNFLQSDADFLKQVDSILIEWHKWRVALPDVQSFLQARGFKLGKILDESDQMGTAFFTRS